MPHDDFPVLDSLTPFAITYTIYIHMYIPSSLFPIYDTIQYKFSFYVGDNDDVNDDVDDKTASLVGNCFLTKFSS